MPDSSKSLRLLFLADAVFEDQPGGAQTVARELARGLATRGHQVTFLVPRLAPGAPDDETHGNVRIVGCSGRGKAAAFVRAGRAACARLWSETPFDIVHTHFAYAALGPLQSVPRGTPRIRTFHGPWDEEGWFEDHENARSLLQLAKALVKKNLRYRIEAANLRRSDQVTVLGHFFRRQVIERFGIPASRVHKIPGGVDIKRFCLAGDKSAARQKLGLPLERPILLSIRRLAPRMGLDRLIEAMPAIAARHANVLLLLGGKGPDRERLEAMISALRLEQWVKLVGFIPDEQLVDHYRAADVFVLPTIALEGFGLVTVEALACGTPVIGTAVGATPEILSRLDARLLVPEATSAALAERIGAFLAGDWQRELTPERLHAFVQSHYTWQRHIDEVEGIYRQLMTSRTISISK